MLIPQTNNEQPSEKHKEINSYFTIDEINACNLTGEGRWILKETEGKGWGIYALQSFQPSDLIFNSKAKEVKERDSHTIQKDLNTHIIMDLPAVMINHSCDANVGIRDNEFGAYDFFAIKPIQADSELTWDYGCAEFEVLTQNEIFRNCLCGTDKCRKEKISWMDASSTLKKQYNDFVADYLKSISAVRSSAEYNFTTSPSPHGSNDAGDRELVQIWISTSKKQPERGKVSKSISQFERTQRVFDGSPPYSEPFMKLKIIKKISEMQLAQFLNKPSKKSTIQFNDEKSSSNYHKQLSSETGTVLASDRVHQLRRELEDLDEKLMNTNTINFEEIRQQMNQEDKQLYQLGEDTDNYLKSNLAPISTQDLENQFLQQSYGEGNKLHHPNNTYGLKIAFLSSDQQQDLNKQIQFSNKGGELIDCTNYMQGSNASTGAWNNQLQKNYMNGNQSFINTSHLSGDGDVSFDYEKIVLKRNQNIQQAFENNLKEKQQLIQNLNQRAHQYKKECDAKLLKYSHLKYERDTIINQIQVESIKKKEIQKEASEELKRINIKKREDERAYSLAQEEIKRQMNDQEKVLDGIISQVNDCEINLEDLSNYVDQQRSGAGQINQLQSYRALNDKITSQEEKIDSLQKKRNDVEQNLKVLKDFLRQLTEEIQMTQEDLNGKLIQRAEFVAEREELDQMFERGKQTFGKDFELYLRLVDLQNTSGESSTRFLSEEYEQQKALSFFNDVLQQLRQATKNKHQERIDQLQLKFDQQGSQLGLDRLEQLICQTASQIGLQLDKRVLNQKLEAASEEKDHIFEKRQAQLSDISLEIKIYEKLIKDNTNQVDNMILPQLKAMTTTYNDHKTKYKKLKQACFVIKERVKKAERELQQLYDDRDKAQQHQNIGTKVKILENEMKMLNERLNVENDEMNRLKENASQIEREYRRAQQALYLKEREIQHKIGENFNASSSQLAISVNNLQENQDDEKSRKRLQEIDDKLKRTQEEKEECDKKFKECSKLLQEAKESYDHAQQSNIFIRQFILHAIVLKSTQMIIEKSQQTSQNTSQRNPNTVSYESLRHKNYYENNNNNNSRGRQQNQNQQQQYQSQHQISSNNSQQQLRNQSKEREIQINLSTKDTQVYQNLGCSGQTTSQFSNSNATSVNKFKVNNERGDVDIKYNHENQSQPSAKQANFHTKFLSLQYSTSNSNRNSQQIIANQNQQMQSQSSQNYLKMTNPSQRGENQKDYEFQQQRTVNDNECGHMSSQQLRSTVQHVRNQVSKIDLTKAIQLRDQIYANNQKNESNDITLDLTNQHYNQQTEQPQIINNRQPNVIDSGARIISKNATIGTNNMGKNDTDSQALYNSNYLNLSDLNNSTLQNIIQMNGLQDSRLQTQNSNIMGSGGVGSGPLGLFIDNGEQGVNFANIGTIGIGGMTDEYNRSKQACQITFNNTCTKQQQQQQQIMQQTVLRSVGGTLNNSNNYNQFQEQSPHITNERKYQPYYFDNNNQNTQNIIVGSGKILNETSDAKALRDSQYNHNSSGGINSMFLMDSKGPNSTNPINLTGNQSGLIDSSLVLCLDDITNATENQHQHQVLPQQKSNNKRNSSVLRRTSVETADFFPNQDQPSFIKQGPITIDADVRNNQLDMMDDDEIYLKSPEIGVNNKITKRQPDINQLRAYGQQQNFTKQGPYQNNQYSSQTNDYQNLSTSLIDLRDSSSEQPSYSKGLYQKRQTSINKYLSSKALPQGTAIGNSRKKSESISPQQIAKHHYSNNAVNGGFSKYYNRSSSVEKKLSSNQFGGKDKGNLSIGSIPSSVNYLTIHNQSCYDNMPLNSGMLAGNRSNSKNYIKKSHKLNKSVNQVDSSVILRQSANSSLYMVPLTNMSINLNNASQLKNQNFHHQNSCNSNNNLDTNDFLHFTKVELQFAERILPLLDGTSFYKKFSSRQSLNENAFDPLTTDKNPPETCGYGIRFFQLDKSLLCINIKQSLKNAVETSISLSEIVKPILPQTTMDIIKAQKQYSFQHQNISHLRKSSRNNCLNSSSCASSTKDLLEEFLILDNKGGLSSLAKIGIVNKNSDMYRQKCLDTTFYPFSLALTQGRVELIATSYEVLKNWIIGINLLVSNKKHINKIKQLMELKLE